MYEYVQSNLKGNVSYRIMCKLDALNGKLGHRPLIRTAPNAGAA
jgi:hypothetical protein